MKFRKLVGAVLMAWLGLLCPANAQFKTGRPSVDDLIDWADPLTISQQKLTGLLDANTKDRSNPIYSVKSYGTKTGVFFHPMGTAKNSMLEETFFSGLFKVSSVEAWYPIGNNEKATSLAIILSDANTTKKKLDTLETLLGQKTGDTNPRKFNRNEARGAARGAARGEMRELDWVNPKYMVHLGPTGLRGELALYIVSLPNSAPVPQPQEAKEPPSEQPALSADLDALLYFTSLWQWSVTDLEKNYVLKLQDKEKQQKLPQFEWVNTSHDRARFSRHMFSDVETKLSMFGGSTKVEEAILEFANGKAARATISFYNRGDSGDITTTEFDRILKLIGQNLSQVMKVAPKRQMMSSNAALPVAGWLWTSPNGIALLEYNEYNTPGKVTKPEFLRLKLAAPNQADWSMGKLAVGVQRMELVQRVTKKPDGDVYITGVPMVDQGQKGYCVAASCQRLFEYMRIPCDQHEMAKLVGVDAESGVNPLIMQKSLAKIDGAFKVTFKPLIDPEQFYVGYRKRRISEKTFISLVKEYMEKGVPLLWALALGEKPEDPPLPGDGQVSGGHMRMIIGYNLAKNQVLFTDSWGAGHELKRMAMLDAYDVTLGLFSMAPRGF
jgi:peptidase C39-like protein